MVIYGHGLADSQFGAPSYIASTLAQKGFATLAIEITGHGYGPLSVVNLVDNYGITHTVSTPGRGLPLSANGTFGPADGCIALGAVAVRDCGRQTAVDLSALVHAIPAMQGLGINLDSSRAYYVGQSFGGTYGTLFHAVEPGVRAAVLNGDGGTSADVARLSITGRPLGEEFLSSVNPALLNVASGAAPSEAYFHDKFNDNYPLRDQAPVVNDISGAMDIQAAFEAADWLGMLGDPLSFAPHLSTSPLAGVPAKSTLFQFGYGDLEVSNPTESAVVLAANAQSSTSFFHFERAAADDPNTPNLLWVAMLEGGIPFPILPHRVLSNPTIFSYPSETSVALAEQQQVAGYFASNGASVPNANLFLTAPFSATQGIFELSPVLPEALNFLQIPK